MQAQDPPLRDFFTAYAAVVSTVALGVSVYVALRDRSDVRVSLRWGFTLAPGDSRVLTARAVNHGRRPVTLTSYELSLSSGDKLGFPVPAAPLPVELSEGQEYVAVIPLPPLQQAILEDMPPGVRVTALVFSAADGRRFRYAIPRGSAEDELLTPPPR